MNLKALILILLAASGSFLLAQTPAELETLRQNYHKAVDRATKPLTDTYVIELKKLMDRYTKAARLEEALKVKEELEELSKGSVPTVADPNTGAPPDSAPGISPEVPSTINLTSNQRGDIEKQIVGTLWVDTKHDYQLFYFRKGGSGTRVLDSRNGDMTPFQWEVRDDGAIAIQRSERYFRFTFPDTGEYVVPPTEIVKLKLVPNGSDPEK